MDLERASQIIAAEEKIPVMLDGEPVWLEQVDTDQGQVHVHFEQSPNEKLTVDPQSLQELQ